MVPAHKSSSCSKVKYERQSTGRGQITAFNAAGHRIAAEFGLETLDAGNDFDDPSLYSDDRHYNEAGAKMLYQKLLPYLQTRL